MIHAGPTGTAGDRALTTGGSLAYWTARTTGLTTAERDDAAAYLIGAMSALIDLGRTSPGEWRAAVDRAVEQQERA